MGSKFLARLAGGAGARCPARGVLAILLMACAAAAPAMQLAQPLMTAVPLLTGTVLDKAERIDANGNASTVTLPDRVELAPGEYAPAKRTYRLHVRFDSAPGNFGLFIPGLLAHARIDVNGATLEDTAIDPMGPLPRSIDRIGLITVPDSFWRFGENTITIHAAGPRWFSLSAIQLGPMQELTQLQRGRVLGLVIGPAVVAAVVGTLGLCMLMLWSRRRESLYGYFGMGALGWAVHTTWTVLPWSLLSGVHQTVWWTSLYSFFVVMLVIFCVRFAAWDWPRFERALWAVTLAGPVFLYAAAALGKLDSATDIWRLVLVAVTGIGAAAVGNACYRKPDMDRLLIALSGVVSFAFGAHDWIADNQYGGNNPVQLVPYAGMLFVIFVVRMLIDGFARTHEQLETINSELEARVAAQGAELRDTMGKMRVARDSAEATNLAKTRFLAAASHDLRQPAHALALYMAALRAERLDANQADLVSRMTDSLTALGKMFNRLLDVSRIDAGALKPQIYRFELEPLLRRLAQEFGLEAESKGLRLALRLPAAAAAAESDPALVERILRNLLSNAVKYTSQGGVLLSCRARRSTQGGELEWHIEVWDTGIGIASEQQQRIFEEFFQIGNPGRNRAQGLGLGLSIVERLVKLLCLSLDLQSSPSHGSRFCLRLPQAGDNLLVPEVKPAPPSTAYDERPATLADMTVAIIEDDAEVRDAMQVLLDRWGCRSIAGADAAEVGAQWHKAMPPDAIVADYRLHDGRTGPGEVQALFERWNTPSPVLIITGEADVADLQDVKAAGYRCMAKPVSPSALRGWLARHHPRQQTVAGKLEVDDRGPVTPRTKAPTTGELR